MKGRGDAALSQGGGTVASNSISREEDYMRVSSNSRELQRLLRVLLHPSRRSERPRI